MNSKQKVIETLKDKRTEQVWELIEKSFKEIYKRVCKTNLEIAKEEYLGYEGNVNCEEFRYLIVEHYNLDEGFYCKFYGKNWRYEDITIGDMLEDYFSDCDGGSEEILLIDMNELKCYLISKEVKYHKQKVKIK